jgi:hypothetical protein
MFNKTSLPGGNLMSGFSTRAFCLFLIAFAASAQIPRQDSRNTDIPNTNTHFRMPDFRTREQWLAKAAFLRKQILSSAGLLPMPKKMAVHAEIFDSKSRRSTLPLTTSLGSHTGDWGASTWPVKR